MGSFHAVPTRRRLIAAAAGLVTLSGCGGDDEATEAAQDVTATSTPTAAHPETPTDEATEPPTETATPSDAETETAAAADADASVAVASNEFTPEFLTVEPGATVLFEHASGTHTVTFYHDAGDRQHRVPEGVEYFDESFSSGDTASVVLERPGVYDYYCKPHESLGMVGSVVVGENDDPDQPGLSEPGSDVPDGAAEALRELNDRAREELGTD